MIILPDRTIKRSKIVKPQLRSEWSPSQRTGTYGRGNWTRYAVVARLHDGAVRWRGVFEDREDADAFLYAVIFGTINIERELWDLPVPCWHPDINRDVDLSYDFVSQTALTAVTGSNQTHTSDSTWNNSNNTIDTVGGGGGGAIGSAAHGTGGGGGGWNEIANFVFATPGTTTATYQLATGGASRTGNSTQSGNNGNDTWFNGTTLGAASVGSKGGNGGNAAAGSITGGSGGVGTSGTGTPNHDGGAGGDLTGASGTAGSGAGGAAGINGNGNAGASSSSTGTNVTTAGGAGDAGSGGTAGTAGATATGGAGGNGNEWPTAGVGSGGGGGGAALGSGTTTGGGGGNYGGGGGGIRSNASGTMTSGAGNQGLVVLTWTVAFPSGWDNQTSLVGWRSPTRSRRVTPERITGHEAPFQKFVINSWPSPPDVQPSHPRPERAGAIMPDDDGSEGPLIKFLATDWPSPIVQPRIRVERIGAVMPDDDGCEGPLVSFLAQEWPSPIVQPRVRAERAGAIMPDDDGLGSLIKFLATDWPTPAMQPRHPKPERAGAIMPDDDGSQAAFILWNNAGWEIQPPQPPQWPKPQRGASWLRGDDGSEAAFIRFVALAWPSPDVDPRKAIERAGLLMRGDDGVQAALLSFLASGWMPTPPPDRRPFRRELLDIGHGGIEAIYVPTVTPLLWTYHPDVIPRAVLPQLRAGAIMVGDQGNEAPQLRWFNTGWEIQTYQPQHLAVERRGGFLRGDDGVEAAFVSWRNAGWELMPTTARAVRRLNMADADVLVRGALVLPAQAWESTPMWRNPPAWRSAALMRGIDIEVQFARFLAMGFEPVPALVRPVFRRSIEPPFGIWLRPIATPLLAWAEGPPPPPSVRKRLIPIFLGGEDHVILEFHEVAAARTIITAWTLRTVVV